MGTTFKLSSDHPVQDPAKDLLGYAPFARMLAHSVLRGSPASGHVVGIYGDWGLGKTTLLHFIQAFVEADPDDEAPLVLRFNPWWFSGREDLLRRFFLEFERAVLKRRAKSKRLRDALSKFGDAIANAPVSWVAGVGKVVAAAARLAQPADVVGLHDELVAALAAEALRVVVLIDDIDRLLPAEILDVCRLVRSVGDFPNVHYVLAFDRRVVAKALSDECHTDGNRYLEKIVQTPFDLPRPAAPSLHMMFGKGLDEILGKKETALWDEAYWSSVFLDGIAPLLRTPRDVARLLNAVSIVYPSVRSEVNPVDLVGIEALRVFYPHQYDIIRSNQDQFVGLRLAVQHLREEVRAFHERWLAGVSADGNPGALRALVSLLFPAVASVLGGGNDSAARDPAMRPRRRVAVEQLFPVYFRYGVDVGLSRAAFSATLQATGAALAAQLRRYAEEKVGDERTKLGWFAEMLHDDLVGGNGSLTNAPELLRCLCEVAEQSFGRSPRTPSFLLSEEQLVTRTIVRLAAAIGPEEERERALMQALDKAGPCTVARVVALLGSQQNRHGPPREAPPFSARAPVDALERYARSRIEAAASTGTIWEARRLPPLLLEWRRLGGGAEMRAALRAWTREPENLLRVLREVCSRALSGEWIVEPTELGRLLDMTAVAADARMLLAAGGASDEDAALLQAVLGRWEATAEQRARRRTELAVLEHVLTETASRNAFPPQHAIRAAFEAERVVIDGLVKERLLSPHGPAYFVTIQGLGWTRAHPWGARNLAIAATWLHVLQDCYRRRGFLSTSIQELEALLHERVPDAVSDESRRALVQLQVWTNTRGQIISLRDAGETLSQVALAERILDFDIAEALTEDDSGGDEDPAGG